MLLEFAAVIAISYLVGSIPSGYIVGRALKGIDVREFGSGAIGATNVMRTLGRGPFLGVLLADALKGYIPVLVTWFVFESHGLQVASGLAAVLGHDFPLYIGFRGGRGVATSFGVYAALAMPVSVSLLAVGLFIMLTFRYMSLMSLVMVPLGALVLLVFAILGVGDDYTYTKAVFGAFATALVLVRHLGNIRRLIQGTEPKLGEGGDRQKRAVPGG
ncbi:MAG: glycerol-3-phosphate 1-O-acyltransferase PlsY [Chloroflexi bacterium]|jgi:glycerol-3-phosphate acyltransferase PlsY|nr:glycerol-3-phosphate 1-O-acyltransferase PlsY [Chloroflexota bacterium]